MMQTLEDQIAANVVAGTYQNLAIVGALAERGLIDPLKVAAWAETFAQGFEGMRAPACPARPEHFQEIADRLRDYAGQIKTMVNPPAGAGKA